MARLLLFIFLCICLSSVTLKKNVPSKVMNYLENYHHLALIEQKNYGIPASITLAQAILESDSGLSELACRSNNHFGIKCKSYWTGQKVWYMDDDYDKKGNPIPSCFRKYDSVKESYRDRSIFLRNTIWYQHLFKQNDYHSWAKGLASSGYATREDYAEVLITIIEKYELYLYDSVKAERVKPEAETLSSRYKRGFGLN